MAKQRMRKARRGRSDPGYIVLLTSKTRLGAPVLAVSRPFGGDSDQDRRATEDPDQAEVFGRRATAAKVAKKIPEYLSGRFVATVYENRGDWRETMKRRAEQRPTPLLDLLEENGRCRAAEPATQDPPPEPEYPPSELDIYGQGPRAPSPPGTLIIGGVAVPLKRPGPRATEPDPDTLTRPEKVLEFYRQQAAREDLDPASRLHWKKRYQEETATQTRKPRPRRGRAQAPPPPAPEPPPEPESGPARRLYLYAIRKSEGAASPVVDRVYSTDPETAVADARRLNPGLRGEHVHATREAELAQYRVTDATDGPAGTVIRDTYTYSEEEAVEYAIQKQPELAGRKLEARKLEKP